VADESNNNNEVVSLDGLDLDQTPAKKPEGEGGGEVKVPEEKPLSPEQLAEAQFQKIKAELDRDLPGPTIVEILREEDSEFIETLNQVLSLGNTPVPDDYNFHNDAIGVMYVVRKFQKLFLDPSGVLRRRWGRHVGPLKDFTAAKKQELIEYLLYLKKGGYKDLIAKAQKQLGVAIQAQRAFAKFVWTTPRLKKLYFILFLGSIYLSYFFAIKIITKQKLPGINLEGVTSFEQVADNVFPFGPDTSMEQFDSPIRHSDYTVLLGKVVANLRPTPATSGQPMGAFRFHFEASTRETAMELVDREKELLDLMQRAIEEMTWDELSSTDGKEHLKLILRKKINEALNRGRVKKVLFETIILKN
jgi:flagellar basal body-associated protein FliL